MYVAEHTGLSGQTVKILTDKGRTVIGLVAGECWARLYFLEAEVQDPGQVFNKTNNVQVGKGEIAELEVLK